MFSAGSKASTAVPGPVPYLSCRRGRHTGLWRCSLLVLQPPVLEHRVLLAHFNSLQLLVLTSQGWLSCFFHAASVRLDDLLSLFFHLHFSFLSGSC